MARGEEDWSRRQLAEHSGLSERFIADVEAGTANPSVESLAALAEALSLTVPEMLSGETHLIPRLGKLLAGLAEGEQERVADWLEEKLGRRAPGRRVALIGVRGSGKTTVGQLLGKALGCAFVELDRKVEESSGHRLAQLFELHGEAYYRRLEREVLQKVLDEHRDVVIATGGGLVTSEETYALLKSETRVVWLKARPEEYLSRVQRQGDRRPFDRHPQALLELRAMLAVREPAYRRADLVVDTTRRRPEVIAERLAGWASRSARVA
jgi:XRE family aerobic/anaerobic benzoate catabolism transcriptional regulator